MVKRLWGFSKVRYRGLAKNATRSFVMLGLANLYLARGVLGAGVRPRTAPPRAPEARAAARKA